MKINTSVCLDPDLKRQWKEKFDYIPLSRRVEMALKKDLADGNFKPIKEIEAIKSEKVKKQDIIEACRRWNSLHTTANNTKDKNLQWQANKLKESLMQKYDLTVGDLVKYSKAIE